MADTFKFKLYPKNSSGASMDLTNEVISYSLRRDIFQGCAELTVDINPHRVISLAEEAWEFDFYINERLMIYGLIDTVRRRYSKGTLTTTLSGRDPVQAWTDSSVLIYKTYKKPGGTGKVWSLKSIVQDVIDNSKSITYGGKTVELLPSEADWKITDEAEGAADLSSLTHIATTPGDTIFSFVSGLANSLGLVIYATPQGLITIDKLIRFDADTIFTLKNVPGAADNNILEGELAENIGGYHSYRRIMGQVNGSSYDAEHPWGIDVKSNKLVLERLDTTFQGLQKAKVAEITDTDLTAWTSNPGRFAKDCPEGNRMLQNLRIAENRELFKFTYKVPGHGQQYPNDPAHIANYDVMKQISVQDDLLGIDSKFLIFSVNFEGSRNEQSTTLEIGSAESSKPYKEMYEAIRGGGYILPVITMEPVRIRA